MSEVDNSTGEISAADAVAEMAGAKTTEAKKVTAGERPEDVPEKFWDAEAGTVRHDDVLKSYNELSGKFGAFTGAPEEYVAAISDELKEQGVELVDDDPMMEQAMEFAKDVGMNQEGFSKMVNLYGMMELARNQAETESQQADIASLGDNADRRLNNLSQWANKNLPEDMQEGFKDLAVGADAVKALEQVISMTRNAKVNVNEAAPTSSITIEEIQAMQFAKDENGNRKIQTDPAHKAKYDRMRKAYYGEEEHREMVG